MKIIVCGAGQVGTNIAKQLSKEDNDVTVIELHPERISAISDTLDVNAYVGFCSHPKTLEEAGANQADMIIAVTESDEINMITCQVAHSLFNVPVKIARIRHQNYLHDKWQDLFRKDHMPIDVIISPEIEVARALNHTLHVPGSIDSTPFAEGMLKMVSVRCAADCPILHKPVGRINETISQINTSILGIYRNQTLMIPDDKDIIEQDDEIFFVAEQQHLRKAMEIFGHEEQEARRLIIIGGGNVGLYLAHQLEYENQDVRIRIIEYNTERAEFIAQQMNHASVINGNALEYDILEEANVQATETVIAVSNDDEVNILSSLLAKRFGCQRTVALINRPSYSHLISSLGIDVAINPREITVSSILQHIRRGKIRNVHSICNGTAEILEAEAIEASPIVGKPVYTINQPGEVKIGAIIRNNTIIIPTPETVIQSHDRVILICLVEFVKVMEQIFAVKFEYF